MFDKMPIYISIIAAVIVEVISLILGVPYLDIFTRIVLTIITAYIIAFMYKIYLKLNVFKPSSQGIQAENTEQADTAHQDSFSYVLAEGNAFDVPNDYDEDDFDFEEDDFAYFLDETTGEK